MHEECKRAVQQRAIVWIDHVTEVNPPRFEIAAV
jgi:hypothetical protein